MSDTTPDQPMTNADRQFSTRIAKGRAKQAVREAEMREKIVLAEVSVLDDRRIRSAQRTMGRRRRHRRRGCSQSQHPDTVAMLNWASHPSTRPSCN